MSHTHVVLLGTGTPNLRPDRYQSSLLITVDDTTLVVDCGGGTLQRLAQAHAQGWLPGGYTNLTRLFLTHLHPDHTTGLADFLIGPWVLHRDAPVQVWGPHGTAALVDGLCAAYAEPIDAHRRGLAPLQHPFTVTTAALVAGVPVTVGPATVTPIAVDHGALPAFALRVETPDRVIVVSGDTRPTDALVAAARGCDVLIHEVYSAARLATRPPAWQAYHRVVHTSTVELAAMVRAIRPNLLVLTHQLYWGATDSELLHEISELYDGPVVSGHDLLRL